MVKNSEFRLYPFIEKSLKDLGWDTKNPASGGRVYTQIEFYQHDNNLKQSLGQAAPENIVLISSDGGHRYWTIEAKEKHKDLEKAIGEAKDYAEKINSEFPNMARFATGVAGTDEESRYVRTCYWDGSIWTDVKLNDYESTGFLTEYQCQIILGSNNSEIAEFNLDSATFLEKATEINLSLIHI